MPYQPRHAIIGVEIDGCDFTTDTEFLPWVHKQTTEGIERYQPCVVHGVKINGVWFDACAMGDDFIEEIEYEIQQMPLNAEGDIDEAAIRMGKAEMAKRAAASQTLAAQAAEGALSENTMLRREIERLRTELQDMHNDRNEWMKRWHALDAKAGDVRQA